MERFKKTDLIISIALIIVCTIVSLVKNDVTFIYSYFIVGGWQVISMVVHAVNGWFTRKKSMRVIYHWTVIIIFIAASLTFIVPQFFFIFYIMLFAAPVMALCYTGICYREVREIRERHSLALK